MNETVWEKACELLKAVEDEGLTDQQLYGDWLSHLQDHVNDLTSTHNPST